MLFSTRVVSLIQVLSCQMGLRVPIRKKTVSCSNSPCSQDLKTDAGEWKAPLAVAKSIHGTFSTQLPTMFDDYREHKDSTADQEQLAINEDCLPVPPTTQCGRPDSAVCSLLPPIPNCSPLMLASLTPLRINGSPLSLHSASPLYMDLGTYRQSDTPLLSLELDFGNDDTLVPDDCTIAENNSSITGSTVLSALGNISSEDTPQICVHVAATPCQGSLRQFCLATPSTNLIAQPTPLSLQSAWYDVSTNVPSMQTVARVLQPLFETIGDTGLRCALQFNAIKLSPAVDIDVRQSVSSLLSAFAHPIVTSPGDIPVGGECPESSKPALLYADAEQLPAEVSNSFLTPGSYTSSRRWSVRRRSRSRSPTASRSCSLRSPYVPSSISANSWILAIQTVFTVIMVSVHIAFADHLRL
ncbi:hypothetical protein BC835DRAFT_945164 [Cytidiella melzeri]|nr:hypothetical protein BC835DRAFT_945164 [Cytidiella melzeri]